MNKYGYYNCVGLLFLLYCSTATAGRIAPWQLLIRMAPVTPAGEFVECALLVALADVAVPGQTCTDEVEIVE